MTSLSTGVDRNDVTEAARLLRAAIKESATDPRTGLIDMDLLTTGIGSTARHQLDDLKREIRRRIIESTTSTIRWAILYRETSEQSEIPIPMKDFEQVIHELETEQFLTITGGQGHRMIRRLAVEAEIR